MNEVEDEGFPDEDVRASLADERLQRENRFEDLSPESRRDMEEMRVRAIEGGAGRQTSWIYFESPQWTWENLCGRAGWLLYDPDTGKQHEFILEALS